MKNSSIEWTDHSWNPHHGCRMISDGCRFCYMYTGKKRFGQDPTKIVRSKTVFDFPLTLKEPALIFACSWSDFFIEEADQWRAEAWEIIRITQQHRYQILTKRPHLIADRLPVGWPFPNVILGVTVENRKVLHRIETLRTIQAEAKFISIEPLLEDLGQINLEGIDWVIVGGESGVNANKCRKMDPAWVRSIRDQCISRKIPFFFKQVGNWGFDGVYRGNGNSNFIDGLQWLEFPQMLKIIKSSK